MNRRDDKITLWVVECRWNRRCDWEDDYPHDTYRSKAECRTRILRITEETKRRRPYNYRIRRFRTTEREFASDLVWRKIGDDYVIRRIREYARAKFVLHRLATSKGPVRFSSSSDELRWKPRFRHRTPREPPRHVPGSK